MLESRIEVSTELRKQDLRPRVRFLVDLLQTLDARVRVDLRRRDRRVAEQLLHRSEIGASVEQMRGKGVPQRVHAQSGVLVDLIEQLRHNLLDGADADSTPGSTEENGVSIARFGSDPAQQLVTAFCTARTPMRRPVRARKKAVRSAPRPIPRMSSSRFAS